MSGQAEKDLEKLFQEVRKQGGEVTRSTGRAGKHWKITAPDGEVFFTGRTPSDWRSLRNCRAWCQRHGVNFNGRRRVQMAEGETVAQQAEQLGIELPQDEDLVTLKEAAEILSVATSTVRAQPEEILHRVRKSEGRTAKIFYRRSEVLALERLRGPEGKTQSRPPRPKPEPKPTPQ